MSEYPKDYEDMRHGGYGNVSSDGRDVKNWLLTLFSAILLMVLGWVASSVVGLQSRMTRIEVVLEEIKVCLVEQRGTVNGRP